MSDTKVHLTKIGTYGRTTAYLVYLDGENIGRVMGDRVNTKITWWRSLSVTSRDHKHFLSGDFLKRRDAVDALVAHWEKAP